MSKVFSILNILSRVLLGLVLVTALILNLGMAYIMFAPDSMPKPFYLAYTDGRGGLLTNGVAPVQAATEGHATEEGAAAPTEGAEVEGEATEEAPVEIKPGEGVMLNTGTKIINLADTVKQRFIRLNIVLEFEPPAPAEGEEEHAEAAEGEEGASPTSAFEEALAKVQPAIDDVIISAVSTKTFDQLYTAEGKEAMRQELMAKINERLPEYHILSVYFTEFVVE